MAKYFVVLTTFPEKTTAEKVCNVLINEKLAACCQILDGMTSLYWWNKKIEKSKECLCLFKTEKSVLGKLKKAVRALHPYKIPEIVCLEIKSIDIEYGQWLYNAIKRKDE